MIDIDEIRRSNLRRLESELSGPAQTAAAVGMSTAQFINLRDGAKDSKTGKPRGMRKETARRIERAAGKPEGWLDTPPDLSLSSNTQSSRVGAKSVGDESNTEPGPALSGRVPLVSWVQAGDWAHAADLLSPGEAFEWIDTTVTVQAHTFALRVTGDSMEPDFPAGMILVVEPEMDAQPGDFVIVKNGDDEATFKQLVRDGADLYLKPLNPRYPIKPLGRSKIVGVVREAVRKLR